MTVLPVNRRDRRAIWYSFAIGLLTTGGVLLAYLVGWMDRIEALTLDLRFQHTNSIRPDPQITVLGIDNTSLDVVGRWPWPRDKQAPLISIPSELGAKQILVDLIWSEPETVRSDPPQTADLSVPPRELSQAGDQIQLPDLELAAAIANAGNVYLSFDYMVDNLERSTEFQRAVDALTAGDERLAAVCIGELEKRRHAAQRKSDEASRADVLERARVVAQLQNTPTLSEQEAAEVLGQPLSLMVLRDFDILRGEALRRLAALLLRVDSQLRNAAYSSILPALYRSATGKSFDPDSTLARQLGQATRTVLGEEATLRRPPLPIERATGPAVVGAEAVNPAYFLLARAAKNCGFVVFEPEADGVVRRSPIVARHGSHVMSQIALAAALDALDIRPDGITCSPNSIQFSRPGWAGPRELPIDESGQALIPWAIPRGGAERFGQAPADAVWSLHVTRQSIERNTHDLSARLDTMLATPQVGNVPEAREVLERYQRHDASAAAALCAANFAEVREQRRQRDLIGARFGTGVGAVGTRIEPVAADFERRGLSIDDAEVAPWRRAIEAYNDALALLSANAKLREQAATQTEELRGLFDGKIVLVGYTATALADQKPIPTSKSAPGVLAHVNLLNGLLTGQFLGWTSRGWNAAFAAAAGLIVTLISARLRPRLGFLLVAFLAVAYVAIAGAVAFHQFRIWIALTPVVAALLVPFVLISVYRYVFIDSERRQLATALGQYTSKEIARQMADNPELCRRAESREVSAMFTDLKGFTTISERIGAERTQKVLNICLGRFTEIMLEHSAMVNKFIGDGIFAFWNPVIFPQPEHALQACETAIDLHAGLDALKREMKAAGGDAIFDEVFLRVGVATGNAIVGPCGSEQKYDYTCIGDSVNLAARLESANKFFGTRTLVAGAAREQVGERFIFRSLGGVRVKGKAVAVPVYEPLGRADEVTAEDREYAAAFDRGVGAFQRREWRKAMDIFDACTNQRKDDLAAQEYYEATVSYLTRPPGGDWNGAIELTEK
ncbi:MAG: CHASE2 domain-containing protein [Planctomycetes bacterium]|nr:CHASE2 domain-containing protein [Planctomycetota bacterium]